MPAFCKTVSPVCSEERRRSQISFLALSAPLQMNDFGGTLRDLEKSCGRLSRKLPPLLSEKLCATNRALESNFFMKNSAFYFHLSLCLVCFSFFFFQFEKEFTDHQETQAQLQKKEAEINELQAELQAFKSQVKYYLPGVNLGIENL